MFRKLEKVLVILLLPLAAILCFAPEYWVVSLVKAMAMQIMIAILCFSFIWIVKRQFKHASIGLISGLMLYSMMPPIFNLDPDCAPANGELRIAHFNVFKFNENYEATITAAKQTEADFISFQEVNQKWEHELTANLCDEYPYILSIPLESCCFGIAVFSKHPLTDLETFYSGSLPNIRGNMLINDTKVHFITSHTSAPTSYNRYMQRNQHLNLLASRLHNVPGPTLAIGDYNSVPWDSAITSFKKATLLIDSRKTLTPTYPAYLKIAQIPLDYIFHSKELICLGFTSIEGTSSDHLGILGTYKFTAHKDEG